MDRRMGRAAVTAAAGLSFVLVAAPAQADSVYDLRAAAVENVDEVGSFSLTVDGITATLTALVNGSAGVLNRTAGGFGVNAAASGDLTDQIDTINGAESVRVSFDRDVLLTQLALSLYTPSAGDVARLALPQQTVELAPLAAASDVYAFSSLNRVNSGQWLTLGYVAGNGFSFDGFSVALAPSQSNATTQTVPVPAAVWGGLGLFGALGAARLRSRHRACDDGV